MRRALSNKNVMEARFKVVKFDGPWKASIGCPELCGTWMVFGGSGCGKTTFVLQLCKYLTNFGRVAYDSLEQGLSLSMVRAWERVGMQEVGSKIIFLPKEELADLKERLHRKRSPDIIVIDSVQYLTQFYMPDYVSLRNEFPNKLFIFISHESRGQPDGKIAQKIRYDADVKIRVEGYKAFFTTRYEDASRGEGGADYVIWAEGAREYWSEFGGAE